MLRNSLRRLQLQQQPLCAAIRTRNISTSNSLQKERSINRVQLLGRVGQDPKQFGTEKTFVLFSLATNRDFRYTNEDGTVVQDSKVSWHLINIRAPGTQNFVMDYVRKGARMLVNGRIDYTQVKKEDGSVKDRSTIVADEIILLSEVGYGKSEEGETRETGVARDGDEFMPTD